MKYLSEIWGPHYWFVLHTIALNYPKFPNNITKRKYYDLISNLPLFIPNREISDEFVILLNKYPVIPYLDDNNSFSKWVHFIHNRINEKLNKPIISYNEFLMIYENLYSVKENKISAKYKKKQFYYILLLLLLIILIIYMIKIY